MNKFSLKSFISGVIVATIGITTVFAAGGIKSATFNTNKVIFNGVELNLQGNQMVSIIKDSEDNASNYMPVRAVLEQMGYSVDWDSTQNAVIVNDKKIEGDNKTMENQTEQTINNDVVAPIASSNINDYHAVGELVRQIEDNTDGKVLFKYNIETKDMDILVDGNIIYNVSADNISYINGKSYIAKSYYESTIVPLIQQYNK